MLSIGIMLYWVVCDVFGAKFNTGYYFGRV